MASKAKDVSADDAQIEEEKVIAQDEPTNKTQLESENGEELSDDDATRRQQQRKGEWGTQCDRWLIRCQQKGKAVELHLNPDDNYGPGSGVAAVPKRIDQYFVQFDIGGREVWVNKRDISGIGEISSSD